MSRHRVLHVAALIALATALAACGKQGVLERPAPLFGTKARAEYEAEKAQDAKDDAQRAQQRSGTTSSSSNSDNAPRTTRDVLDPGQRLSPASSAPIPGAPNPLGAPVQAAPPR
jgi:predicted small lipoprotein YifL